MVFSRKCRYCKRVFKSSSESQLKYNYQQHIEAHERKKQESLEKWDK